MGLIAPPGRPHGVVTGHPPTLPDGLRRKSVGPLSDTADSLYRSVKPGIRTRRISDSRSQSAL